MEIKSSEQVGKKLMRLMMFTLTLLSMSILTFIVVLPEISKEFNLTIAKVSWFSSVYGLIYAIGTVTYGILAGRYKLKNLLTFGLIVFGIGSLLGLISQTFWIAIIGRAIQAVGAAVIPAVSVIIPIRYFAPEHRGRALGMIAVGLALGGALGPVISAFIVSVANWRWLFAIPLVILLTIPFYREYLKDEQHIGNGDIKFDWIGGSLFATTVALLLLGVTNGNGWFTIISLLALGLFIVRIHLVDEPFISPKLFINKRYTIGIMIAFLMSAIGTSIYLLSPLLLSHVQQIPVSWIGFAMVPAAAASAILGSKGGKLADLKGNSYLFFLASGLLFTCFVLLSTFTGKSSFFIAVFLILGNVGQSFMLIALSNSISQTLPKNQAGIGMGLLQMLNFISQAVATGIYGRIVDYGSHVQWNPANIPPNSFIYSNIFFVLAVLIVIILLVSYFQFNREMKAKIQG